jgi:peptide-methionine (S)-S-oxide reductase
METIYIAGGCLWRTRVLKQLPGVLETQAGRAYLTKSTKTAYDGYAECVKTL